MPVSPCGFTGIVSYKAIKKEANVMPIKVEKNLPAINKLANENIFIMDRDRAEMQDFRSLEIVIVNLMPTKEATEEQLLRLLSNSPLQVNVTFVHMSTHHASNVSQEHLTNFYCTFEEISNRYFDGMIVTGAPVEQFEFKEVNYWEELMAIMKWSNNHVFSTLNLCWGAQAALYYHFDIRKQQLNKKLFGVYEQELVKPKDMLVRGLDDIFLMPHSRHTNVDRKDIENNPDLEILVSSEETGISVVHSVDNRFVFIFGHVEYDADTLEKEYLRDSYMGKAIDVPKNYYPNDDPTQRPLLRWRSAANMLFSNWLNYYVYQATPFVIEKIDGKRK